MLKTFEEVRADALDLDRESQRKLVDEIEQHLSEFDANDSTYNASFGNRDAAIAEGKRRLDAHRRGEGTTLSPEESLAKGRAMIEQAKRRQA